MQEGMPQRERDLRMVWASSISLQTRLPCLFFAGAWPQVQGQAVPSCRRCEKASGSGPEAWGRCWGSGPPWAGKRAHSVFCISRREDKLRIQNGWLCHLAPEIIRQLSPDTEEDKLPFSKHSDVFALG